MLVLDRKEGEDILVGPDIVVTVLHLGRSRVRIGVTAPKEVVIMRRELVEKEAADAEGRNQGCQLNCKSEGPPGPIWCSLCGHDPKCCTCED
jgi:carbon storage regulator